MADYAGISQALLYAVTDDVCLLVAGYDGIPRALLLCRDGRRLSFYDGIRWHSTSPAFVPTARKARLAGEMVAHAAIAAESQRAARLVFVSIGYPD